MEKSKKEYEFKISILRQFGSENISFTEVIKTDKPRLTEEEIDEQIDQMTSLVRKGFISVMAREISEKSLLAETSQKRLEEVEKLDKALQDEMKAKEDAERTMMGAEKFDRYLKEIKEREAKIIQEAKKINNH